MFKLTKIEGGRINVFEPEILPVGGAKVLDGQALVLSGGALVDANGAKPTFIALSDCEAGKDVSVGRVADNQVYEVALSAVPGDTVKVGVKLATSKTAAGNTMFVSISTTSGVAEVVSLNGATKSGDKILVRFS
jgi:hypothetical protein